jgi:hypothetical protein
LGGQAQARVVNDVLRHEDGVAALAKTVRDVLLLPRGADLPAVFLVLNRNQHGVIRLARP